MDYKEKVIALLNNQELSKEQKEKLGDIFPELIESEDKDEKIRKALIDFFNKGAENEAQTNGVCDKDIIAWLEKQDSYCTKRDVGDAYLKGVTDTKNEIEKQYEASYQIRKDIATFILNYKGDIKDRAKWMDYLGIDFSFVEKQGEQKITDEYEGLTDFERTLADICIGWIGEELGWKQYIKDNADVLLKIAVKKFNSVQDAPFEQNSIEPDDLIEESYQQQADDLIDMVTEKPAWSEEDERMFHTIIADLKGFKHGNTSTLAPHFDNCIAWLKSLKERYTWKPSDEQIEALHDAIIYVKDSMFPSKNVLKKLYGQLKKLRKE